MEEDNINLECDTCGGTDFTKEYGYFYCNECQTQSQCIKEEIFAPEIAGENYIGIGGNSLPNISLTSKKLPSNKVQRTSRKLTSWECYNIILKNLTDEVIRLGANPLVKKVVQNLWLKYLNVCEVLNFEEDGPPKFSLLGSKKDISALYNISLYKKRIRFRPSVAKKRLNSNREVNKKKRALINSQLDDLSKSQSMHQDTTLELENVKIEPDEEPDVLFHFNEQSEEELRKYIAKKGLNKSVEDFKRDLSNLEFKASDFGSKYSRGPTKLHAAVLYNILYIAFLITEDDRLQLGDFLRFIREGHVSHNSFQHFFNDNYHADCELILPKVQDQVFSSENFRKRTAKLAQFLDVVDFIKTPNLVSLCQNYCKELNLPNDIFHAAEKLIIKYAPEMKFKSKAAQIPNYEARAMSFIIFVLKLLFCLDGITEKKLSEYAGHLNSLSDDNRMFNFIEWFHYIMYRQTALKKYHFPTAIQEYGVPIDCDMILNHICDNDIKSRNIDNKMTYEMKSYTKILNDFLVSDNTNSLWPYLVFPPSFTPFLTYAKVIAESNQNQHILRKDILLRDFSDDSISFLLRPHKYLPLFKNRSVKNGGANDDIVVQSFLHCAKFKYSFLKGYKTKVPVKIVESEDQFIEEYLDSKKTRGSHVANAETVLSNWMESNKESFLATNNKLERKMEKNKIEAESNFDEIKLEHFNCFEKYWLNIGVDPSNRPGIIPKAEMDSLLVKMPYYFRSILLECSRIIEQNVSDLYMQFLLIELYLTKDQVLIEKGWNRVIKNCVETW